MPSVLDISVAYLSSRSQCALAVAVLLSVGCIPTTVVESKGEPRTAPPSIETPYTFKAWRRVEDFSDEVAQFETVFWEPTDTSSLRELIRETALVHEKSVLEIGTGTGLVSLCCLVHGADRVVATDVNPAAIWNARYNADVLEVASRLEVRRVPLHSTGGFAVIDDAEVFDLIISNPPWEDAIPESIDEYALYDPKFSLLHSILAGGKQHLASDGRILLAYGCVDAVREVKRAAPKFGFSVTVLDDRNLDDLPQNFLPGMLLELRAE